jgi:ADP-heptose:LPS heptosyltransferase
VKILVIRFSSIGDIVLTTPVVRALKQQLPGSEIHFITKTPFKGILDHNPNIDKVYTIEKSVNEVISDLKKEKYDHIVDLHKNIRTLSLILKLKRPSSSFPKLNLEKWLLVNLKWDRMPKVHIVSRYFEAVKNLGVVDDGLPCDFFIGPENEIDVQQTFGLEKGSYVTIALGAQFATKRLPFDKLVEIIDQLNIPIIVIGGPMDKTLADKLLEQFKDKKIFSACGLYSLGQSASIVNQSSAILTNDTGLMHIASCFEIPTVSVWGNTVPELGMYPYFPKHPEKFSMHEVNGLGCRPCSKIGFQECPKKHFNCMVQQDANEIAKDLNSKSQLFSKK